MRPFISEHRTDFRLQFAYGRHGDRVVGEFGVTLGRKLTGRVVGVRVDGQQAAEVARTAIQVRAVLSDFRRAWRAARAAAGTKARL